MLNSVSPADAVSSGLAFTSLASSIYNDHDSLSKVIVSKTGINLNSQGVTGNTALMFAALWGATNNAQYLLESGADVTLKNNKGETALSIALKAGNRDIALMLRSYGAKA